MPKCPVGHDYFLWVILGIQVSGNLSPALLAKLGQNPEGSRTKIRLLVVLAEKSKHLPGCALAFSDQLSRGMGADVHGWVFQGIQKTGDSREIDLGQDRLGSVFAGYAIDAPAYLICPSACIVVKITEEKRPVRGQCNIGG